MKRPMFIVGFLVLSSSVFAQSGLRLQDESGRVRVGTGCTLSLYGQPLSGTCNVYREHGSSDTYIQAGRSTYRISRSGSHGLGSHFAAFYQVTPANQPDRFISNVRANGNCWVGDGVRFCAN